LELRFENNVVCIYGTEEGLKEIMSMCRFLLEKPSMGHIHIENNATAKLTPQSLKGAIAIFPKP